MSRCIMISSPPATRRPRGQASYVSPDDTAAWTTHGSRDAWLHLSPPQMRSVDPPTSTPTMRMSPTCKAATKLSRGQASYVTGPGVTARRSGLLMAAVTRDCTSRRFSCSRSPAHLHAPRRGCHPAIGRSYPCALPRPASRARAQTMYWRI